MIRTKKRKPMVRMTRTKKPMVRTKKPKAKPIPESKMVRKKIRRKKPTFTRMPKPKNQPPCPNGGHGGHLPDPPEDCPARKMIVKSENRIYIDSSSCIGCSEEKTCDRRREFEEEWAIYRGWQRENKLYLQREYEKRQL